MIKKWFGKDEENGEVYREYTLDTMRQGYLVDYDLKTWEVTGFNTYDYEGYTTREWELRCGGELRFLERAEEDGQVEWTLTRRIQINQIEEKVIDIILEHDDPPEDIHFEGRSYAAVESSAGLMRRGGEGEGREFVSWSYEAGEDRVLFIVQWGERDFVAYEGAYAEDYQFTDILPGNQE
jgi:hypothetical protein